MAALTYQATVQGDSTHSVVRSTDDAIGSATAALIIDDTLTKMQVVDAAKALLRALSRDAGKSNLPSEFSTSATSIE